MRRCALPLAFAFINPACLGAVAAGIITEFAAEKSAGRVAPGKTKRSALTQLGPIKTFLAPARPELRSPPRACGFGSVKFVSRQGDAHLIQKWTKGITPNAALGGAGEKSCSYHRMHVYWSSAFGHRKCSLMKYYSHVMRTSSEWCENEKGARVQACPKCERVKFFATTRESSLAGPILNWNVADVFCKQSGAKVFLPCSKKR